MNARHSCDRDPPRFPRAGEAEARDFSPRELDDATAWLRDLLGSGHLHVHDVKEHAERCGIAPTLLAKAKRRLGVVVTDVNNKNKHAQWRVWFWSLPPRERSFLDRDDDDDSRPPRNDD